MQVITHRLRPCVSNAASPREARKYALPDGQMTGAAILHVTVHRAIAVDVVDDDAIPAIGVIEATRDEEELGLCGLRRIVRQTGAASARALLDALAEYEHGDDTTVVVVRRG